MTTFLSFILALALTAGQLIKIPQFTGGITIFDITVAFFCLGGILKKRFKLNKPPSQITSGLIFIFITILSLILTPLHLNLTQYLTSFSYTIRFALFILFAWLLYSNAFGNLGGNFKKILLLSGISFAILGLLQFIFFPDLKFISNFGWDPHYFRTVSTFLDPNFAGAFLVLTLLLLVSYLNGKSTQKTYYLFFILTYLALLTTFSRSSYLMFLISGSTFSYLKKSKIFFILTIVLFLTLMGGFKIYSQGVAEPRHIDRTKSASFRLNTWLQGVTIFKKSPMLGTGFNAYRYGLDQYNLGDQQFLQSHGSTSNDSSLLFVLSTTGIIGLIVFLYFLISLFNSLNNRYILIPAILGLLIHSIFANSLFYPPILAWVLIISGNPKK